jgi:membrane-bound lytic murein transglycosylase F
MIRYFKLIFILPLFIWSCNSPSESTDKMLKKTQDQFSSRDYVLDSILSRGKLKAATDYGSVSYLIYRGETIGYQYELLKQFTEVLDVELELVIEKDLDKSMEMLENNEIDLIAMGLTVTTERKNHVEFTDPIITTHQVLVQRKPDNFRNMETLDEIESHLLRNQIDLADKSIYIQKGTIFNKRLQTLADEIGDTIYIFEEDKSIEELIHAVSVGEIDYTIADRYVALVNARYYQNIDINTPISFPQRIAWAVKKEQYSLTDTINSWLAEFKSTLLSRLIYNKYFENLRSGRIARSQYSSYTGGKLSPYDASIKKASKIIGWDWRLLASMIYQESEFKPHVKSWVGAYGLMQMMPQTFEQYGIDTTASPMEQIRAGVKYLKYLEKQLPEEISEESEKIKFTLASYNSGIGHVLDARRLAEKYGKDPNRWTGHVDHFVLNLSDEFYYHDSVVYYGYLRGEETYNFVNEILQRYEDYKNLIKE